MEVFCRKELKFLIDRDQRQRLEEVIREKMEPDPYGKSTIRNLYYDTPDYRLIRRSLEKPVYKEKLRLRCYGSGSPEEAVFLEMKKKYKGIVYKRRVRLTQKQAMDFMQSRGQLPTEDQISRELVYFRDFYGSLAPRFYLSYDREGWFSREDPGLRITLDRNICYRVDTLQLSQPPGGQPILLPEQSLMEVKAENAIPLWLSHLLAGERIHKISFSKYGRAYEQELLKKIGEKRGYHYVG